MSACQQLERFVEGAAFDGNPEALPASLREHLNRCSTCRDLHETLFDLVLESESEVARRVSASEMAQSAAVLSAPAVRFADLVQPLSQIFDLAEVDVVRALERVVDPSAWSSSPWPGIQMLVIDGGARVTGALVGFVKIPPNVAFPMHRHTGAETNYVLQGGFVEHGGAEYWPGDMLCKAAGSVHGYTTLAGIECIAAAVLMGPIDLVGADGETNAE